MDDIILKAYVDAVAYFEFEDRTPLAENTAEKLLARLEFLAQKKQKTENEINEIKNIVLIFTLYEQEDKVKNISV